MAKATSEEAAISIKRVIMAGMLETRLVLAIKKTVRQPGKLGHRKHFLDDAPWIGQLFVLDVR